MVTTELGACEWFIWDLRRSNLIERGQLDQVIGEFLQANPRAEPPALAEYLVTKGILSQFQAERLLQGKTQGFVLGPFTLMDALGAGSMGTVYKAQSKNDQAWYAVKVLPRRSMWNVRIARRKVRAFETCKHPTVVPFVDVGTAGGMHFLAWPFVEGQTLEKVVQAQGKLNYAQAAHVALQIAEGLDACHQQALFHGLLKPSNIMIGSQWEVFILDLGIGCLLAETEGESLVDTMSTANSVASGLDCASPESIMDPTNLTPSGDQYSLGCVLYFCLTGRYPYPDGSSAEKMMAHQFKEPAPIAEFSPDVPEDLVAVVSRLMQKAPDNRFGSVSEVVEALRAFAPLGDTPEAPRPAPAQAKKSEPSASVAAPAPQPTSARANQFSPSAPTPSPKGLSSAAFPTRHSIRTPIAPPTTPAAKASPAPVEAAQPDAAPENAAWDEQLGPVGLIAMAFAACAIVWAAMTFLR
jgi:serine/threonine protein kinase